MSSARPVASSSTTATAAKPRSPAERSEAAVIHLWSARLNRGDYKGIARLFAVPAIFIQAPYEYRLVNRKQIAFWHSQLPCSGRVVTITFHGRYATAVFRLGNRPSVKCDAPGSLAAARFEFVNGKIVEWAQVPVPAKAAHTAPVA
jgi:hypothetical protein